MSCEDDWYDDMYDDWEEIYETVMVDLHITTITKEKLLKIEEGLKLCLDRKLDKLNLLLKQLTVYQANGNLIVNDRYNAILNLEKIVQSFGMDIIKIDILGLKGKSYIISDIIVKLLKVLGTDYKWGPITIEKISENVKFDVSKLFTYDKLNDTYDRTLVGYLSEIKETGAVTIQGTETLINGYSQGIVSEENIVKSKLETYLKDIQQQACVNNRNVQNGTAEILYERARQMGYSVQKEVKGKEVQLVLVRLN